MSGEHLIAVARAAFAAMTAFARGFVGIAQVTPPCVHESHGAGDVPAAPSSADARRALAAAALRRGRCC